MRVQQQMSHKHAACGLAVVLLAVLAVVPAQAAVTWDGGWDGTPEDLTRSQYWFFTDGWNNDAAQVVPPVVATGEAPPYTYLTQTSSSSGSEAVINGTGAWDQGEGVVYAPAEDPYFASTSALPYWDEPTYIAPYFAPQTIWRIYLGNYAVGAANPADSKLTIRGDMDCSVGYDGGDTRWQLGRTSGTANLPITGTIVQESGTVINGYGDIDLGSSNTTLDYTYGNGTYDYRGGTLEQGLVDTARRFRLSGGGGSSCGGIGTLIMHSPDTAGHFRVTSFMSAAYAGGGKNNPDGVNRGVGVVEFHYANDGTRPLQINNNMTLANGKNMTGSYLDAWRSSRLRLVLDEAPTVDEAGVPINLGLFDIDSDGNGTGDLLGPGTGGTDSSLGTTFSNADAIAADPDPLGFRNPAYVYDNLVDSTELEGSDNIVTAMFGESTYRWRIYYDGNITWTNRDNSVVALNGITGEGTGRDIVLIGLDSTIVETGAIGDYNDDGVVDAADYTVWRDHLGTSYTLLNRDPANSGNVSEADWVSWKAHFGEAGGAGAGALAAGAVPEPSSLVLMLLVAVLWMGRGLASRR